MQRPRTATSKISETKWSETRSFFADEDVRMKLLKLEGPTLETVAKVCMIHETSQQQLKAFKKESSVPKQGADSVHVVRATKNPPRAKAAPTETCSYCGNSHLFSKSACLAWGSQCNKCGKKNHFAKQCKTKGSIKAVQESDSSSQEVLVLQKRKSDGIFVVTLQNRQQ